MDINNSIILPFLVFFPMLGGIIGYIIGRKNKNARDYWAMLVTLLTFGASLLLIGKEEAFHETGICGLGLLFAGGGLQVILAVDVYKRQHSIPLGNLTYCSWLSSVY